MPTEVKRRVYPANSRRKTARVVWQVRYETTDPATGETTTEHQTFAKEKAAKDFIADRKATKKQGGVVDPSRELLKDFAAWWLDTLIDARDDVRPHSAYQVRYSLEHYVLPHIGGVGLGDLSVDHVATWHAVLRDAGIGWRTRRHAYVALKQALSYAVESRRVPFNAAASYRFPKKTSELTSAARPEATERTVRGVTIQPRKAARRGHRAAQAAIPPEDTARLLEVLEDHPQGLVFRVLLTCGLRPNEVLALRWSDIDLDAGTLRVERTVYYRKGGEYAFFPPKREASRRTVYLTPDLVDRLKRHRVAVAEMKLKAGALWVDEGLAFPRPDGKPIRRDYLSKHTWRALLRDAGVGKWIIDPETGKKLRFEHQYTMYSTRGTALTNMAQAGVPIKTVAVVAGHASEQTTLRHYQGSGGREAESAAVAAAAARLSGGRKGGENQNNAPSGGSPEGAK